MKNKLEDWIKSRKIIGLIWLMIQAGAYSLIPALFFLYVVVPNHWNILPEKTADMFLKWISLVFGILAGWTFQTALKIYMETMTAIRMGDKDAFQKAYFKRIPDAVEGIMVFLALSILWYEMRTEYQNNWEGANFVFITSYIMYILRQITMGMDDMPRSILYKKEIPQDWLEEVQEKEKKISKKLEPKKTPE